MASPDTNTTQLVTPLLVGTDSIVKAMDELGSVMKAIELSAPNRDGIPGTEEKTTDLPPPAQKTDDTRLEEERQDDTSSNVEEQKVSRPTGPEIWEQINRFREAIYACEKSVKADYDLFYVRAIHLSSRHRRSTDKTRIPILAVLLGLSSSKQGRDSGGIRKRWPR